MLSTSLGRQDSPKAVRNASALKENIIARIRLNSFSCLKWEERVDVTVDVTDDL